MLIFDGGAKGSRTPDLLNAIQTRYQLRYNPVIFSIIQKTKAFVKDFLRKSKNFLIFFAKIIDTNEKKEYNTHTIVLET